MILRVLPLGRPHLQGACFGKAEAAKKENDACLLEAPAFRVVRLIVAKSECAFVLSAIAAVLGFLQDATSEAVAACKAFWRGARPMMLNRALC